MMMRLDRRDIAVIAALTALFLVLALPNLGSLTFPSSSFTPAQADELDVVLEFESA